MATLQAKRIKDALQKVRRVGQIEEAVNIAGCEVTLQNLTQTDFEAALREIEGLEDVAYAHAYQMEQVCRSIIEIDGQDLRDAEFIEDEVPAGSFVVELVLPNKAAAEAVVDKLREQKFNAAVTEVDPKVVKLVKIERSKWLKENILKTWSREALTVAWRKHTELLVKADEKAKTGVQFLLPDETPEDKFRRLLNDLRETEEELPDELTNRLLDDVGLLKKSRREELDAVNERMAKVDKPEEPAPAPAAPAPVPKAGPPAPPGEPPEAIRQAMEARSRMNQQAGGPVPIPSPPREQVPVSATPRPKVPAQIRQAAMQNTQGIHGPPQPQQQTQARQSRANEIAELEAQLDPNIAAEAAVPPPRSGEVAELSHKTQGVDEHGLKSIIDRPPVVGINPRFKPR